MQFAMRHVVRLLAAPAAAMACACCLAAAVPWSAPRAAEPTAGPDSAGATAAPRLTPPGWPAELVLSLPPQGELQVAGVNGVKAEDIDANDFQWDSGASGDAGAAILAIDGAHMKLGVTHPTDDDWASFADWFKTNLLKDQTLKLTATDLKAQFGGRRWVRYDVVAADPASGDTDTFAALATIAAGNAFFVDIDYRSPPAEDLDAQIARVLAGPDAAQ